MTDLFIKEIPASDPRLKRHVVHDPRSRDWALPTPIDKSTWRSKKIPVYDPRPNPNQPNGCCTAVSKCIQLNARGNRGPQPRRTLTMDDAQTLYAYETSIDPFPGQMPDQDTGSNGLAACKAAQHFGLGADYFWIFDGVDGVIQAIMNNEVVSVGTRWENDMFHPDERGQIHLGGGVAGGHQWSVRGVDLRHSLFVGRCWWGDFQDFLISFDDLSTLLADNGDAHVQRHAK